MAFGMPRADHGNRYYLGIDENNAYNLISGSKKLKSSYGLKNGTPPGDGDERGGTSMGDSPRIMSTWKAWRFGRIQWLIRGNSRLSRWYLL